MRCGLDTADDLVFFYHMDLQIVKIDMFDKIVLIKTRLGKSLKLFGCFIQPKGFAKTRFYQDNFMEQIDFDYLEIQVIEED